MPLSVSVVRTTLAVALAFTCTAAGSATARPQLMTTADVISDIQQSQTVMLTAYTLAPTGAMVSALADAASHAHVTVELGSNAFGEARTMNDESRAALEKAGVGVLSSHGPLHLKVALVDRAMFLSDTNWARNSLVLSDDDPDDRSLVAATLRSPSAAGCDETLCTRKDLAIDREARFIAACHGPLFVETESFSGGNAVFAALSPHAARGDRTYLLFVGREARLTPQEWSGLQRAHVHVRTTSATDKIAECGGRVYVGSANASAGEANMVDWGFVTTSSALVDAVDNRFRMNWGP
jgi:hypothetical protein